MSVNIPTNPSTSNPNPGELSSNSSSVTLGAGASFTGDWVDVSKYPTVSTAVSTDASGTLKMQFSPDGVNVDSTLTYDIIAGVPEAPHRLTVARKFFRVVYTNGSTPQTYMRLQTLISNQPILTSPLNLTIGQDADGIVVRNIPAEIDIAEGRREGYSILNKFGRNKDIDTTTTPEDIWDGGGVYPGFPISDVETIDVFSSSANDTAAGSGARTVLLEGLDGNGNEITETVTLNGTTAVTTTNTWSRMSRAQVLTSGNSNQNFNDGEITARHTTTTANVFMVMPVGTNRTQIACYTVPAGCTGYIRNLDVEMDRSSNSNANGGIWIREQGASPQLIRQFSISQNSNLTKVIYGGIVLPELTDVAIRITDVSGNDTDVTAYFDMILVKNT